MSKRAPLSIRRRQLLLGGVAAPLPWLGLSLIVPFRGLAWASPENSLPPALSELLAHFRKCTGLSADFEEEKHIVLLAAPLKSTGRVYFHPPHAIARITEKPTKSHLVVSGKKIVVKEGNTRREVDLSDKPALRELIGSLLHLLSGDEKQLLSDYEAHFKSETKASWSLRLLPKNQSVKKMVESFSFSGSGIELHELRVKEKNGDESITRFSSVNTKRTWSAAEITQIFEI